MEADFNATNLDRPLEEAINVCKHNSGKKYGRIFLLTDG
jgi:hypothetical protein